MLWRFRRTKRFIDSFSTSRDSWSNASPLFFNHPSYLGTPHTWGFLLPRDSLYLGTPFTFFQSSSFFYIFHLCQHDIVIGSVWMSYFLTFWQNFEFIVLIFCFLTFQQFQPKLFNFLRVFFSPRRCKGVLELFWKILSNFECFKRFYELN